MKPIFILTGPSAAGKNAVLSGLLKSLPLVRFITTTTRPPRSQEENGRDYYFVSPQRFREMREKDEFLEWIKFAGHFYGSTKKELRRLLKDRRAIILEIDPRGAFYLKRRWPKESVVIFLKADSAELKRRLLSRGGLLRAAVEARLKQWARDKKFLPQADFIVANPRGKLRQTIAQVRAIIARLL